jgi:hypothetical protein
MIGFDHDASRLGLTALLGEMVRRKWRRYPPHVRQQFAEVCVGTAAGKPALSRGLGALLLPAENRHNSYEDYAGTPEYARQRPSQRPGWLLRLCVIVASSEPRRLGALSADGHGGSTCVGRLSLLGIRTSDHHQVVAGRSRVGHLDTSCHTPMRPGQAAVLGFRITSVEDTGATEWASTRRQGYRPGAPGIAPAPVAKTDDCPPRRTRKTSSPLFWFNAAISGKARD